MAEPRSDRTAPCSWQPHPDLPGCGRFEAPAGYEVWFTARATAIGEPPRPDYARLAAALGCPPERLVRARQEHGARVRASDEPAELDRQIRLLGAADGIRSGAAGEALLALSADCAVVMLLDPAVGAIGVCHSGWRGTAAGVGAALVESLVTHHGARRERLLAYLAPTIGPCCYEVGDEVFEALAQGGLDAAALRVEGPRKGHLDLRAANRQVLERAGVDSLVCVDRCTRCDDGLFSYRRDGAGCGHQAGLVYRTP